MLATSLFRRDKTAQAPPGELPRPAEIQVDIGDLIEQRSWLRGLDLPGGLPARSALSGGHRSRLRGRGMDYRESRHYQAGDDVRSMDWRVTARAGHPHIKVYDQERERPVVVLVDFGSSMFFATRGSFKSVVAARAAALIGWAAVTGGDRIGGLLFNGHHRELKPRGGRRGVMTLLRALTEYGALPPDHATADTGPERGLPQALARLQRVVRPGSLIYLISDFYALDDSDGDCARALALLRRHNQLIAMQVVDPLEIAAPPAGRYGVGQGRGHNRQRGVLDSASRAGRAAYQDYLSAHHQRIRTLLAAQQASHIVLSTNTPVAEQFKAAANVDANHPGVLP